MVLKYTHFSNFIISSNSLPSDLKSLNLNQKKFSWHSLIVLMFGWSTEDPGVRLNNPPGSHPTRTFYDSMIVYILSIFQSKAN